MPPSQDHIAMRQLIRRRAGMPGGYSRADSKGMPGAAYTSQHTDRMLLAGELVRVKVAGHYLHFTRTQEQADALTAQLLEIKGKRVRRPLKSPHARRPARAGPLRLLILATSATPDGATRQACMHLEGCDGAFSKCVTRLISAGLLFRAKVQGHRFHYFSSQSAADAWEATTEPQITPHKARPYEPRPAKPKQPKLAAYKAPKPIASIVRKPYSPPAKRQPAVIIWPEGVKHTVIATPIPRFAVVLHSFVHGNMRAM